MPKNLLRYLTVVAIAASLAACTIPRPPRPFDASNPLKHVAVLPLKNDTVDVDGPDLVRKKMIDALEEKSYIVKDVKETDGTLRDQMGITLGGQLDLTTPQKLGETLGVEGVLYGTLMDFDETTTGLVNVRKVRAKFKLVNTKTGEAMWVRGLGVRTETKMSGLAATAAAAAARGADNRDKDVPWVTVESTTTSENNVGKSFAAGLGAKMFAKAVGIHLDFESKEMARRLMETMPWGPGTGEETPVRAAAPAPKMSMMPKMRGPEPPSFGYMDYGKKDFSALIISVSVNKSSNDSYNFRIPLAKAGEKIRMDMDLSAMAKGGQGMPPSLSNMSTLVRGDKKVSYTLYPNSKKYMTHTQTEEKGSFEKPQVEKTKIGSEVIDGHPTDKFQVKVTYQDGRTQEGLIWDARDLDNMTIKSEVENNDMRVTTELKNIVLKTPAASLFEIPDDYTEAQSFMDLMTDAKKQ